MRFRRAPEAAAPAPAPAPGRPVSEPVPPAAPAPAATGGTERRDLKRRVIAIVLALIAMVLLYLAAAAYIPRWWSHRVADAVDGQLFTGTLLGLCFGIVFTVLPLSLLWLTMRRAMCVARSTFRRSGLLCCAVGPMKGVEKKLRATVEEASGLPK